MCDPEQNSRPGTPEIVTPAHAEDAPAPVDDPLSSGEDTPAPANDPQAVVDYLVLVQKIYRVLIQLDLGLRAMKFYLSNSGLRRCTIYPGLAHVGAPSQRRWPPQAFFFLPFARPCS